MAIGLSLASTPRTFDRHIKRLAWCALIGSIALLVPGVRGSLSVDLSLTEMLGAMVVVIAVLGLVRDVSRYIRQESARRRDVARTSAQAGACRAAGTIHDRVANLLSVTVGYVDFVAEDASLPLDTRQHAQRALDSALAAARVVSQFRQSLGCEADTPEDQAQGAARTNAPVVQEASTPWSYDPQTHTIRAESGEVVATLRSLRDTTAEDRNGHILAEAPALWEVLADAQRLALTLLAGPPRTHAEEGRIREVLQRINDVTDRVETASPTPHQHQQP